MESSHNGVDNSKEWIDVLGNGLLKKKILKCGNAQLERPGNGQNVKIWVKIMQENGDVILGRQKLSFTINGRDVIKALEICVPLMCIHETALILTDSKFCSGRSSSEASEVKPGSRVLLEVELLSVSGTRLEVKPKAEQLQMIRDEREKGNRYFQSKNYKLAILCYTSALTIIDANTKDVLNHEDERSLLDEKVKCYSNIAACHLNTGRLEEAFTCCDIVLQHQPQHCKALFRKGKQFGDPWTTNTKKSSSFLLTLSGEYVDLPFTLKFEVLELQEKYFLSIKFLRKASQVEPSNQEIEREMKLVFDKWAEKSEGTSNAKTVNECSLFLVDDSKVKQTKHHSEMPEECQRI